MDLYKVTLELLTPLHVGHYQMGFVQKTRPYLPGRTFWGAVTAAVTRRLHGNATPQNYIDVGRKIEDGLQTTHFFPTLSGRPFLPTYVNGRLQWWDGKNTHLTHRDLEHRIITSIAKSSLDPQTLTTTDGSLFEIELLNHRHEKDVTDQKSGNRICQTRLTGYLIHNPAQDPDSGNLIDELKAIDEIQFGGERKYGFGLCRMTLDGSKDNPLFFRESGITCSNNTITVRAGNPIPVHLPLTKDTRHLAGDVEPLRWAAWGSGPNKGDRQSQSSPGFGLSTARPSIHSGLFWTPGSVPSAEDGSHTGQISMDLCGQGLAKLSRN